MDHFKRPTAADKLRKMLTDDCYRTVDAVALVSELEDAIRDASRYIKCKITASDGDREHAALETIDRWMTEHAERSLELRRGRRCAFVVALSQRTPSTADLCMADIGGSISFPGNTRLDCLEAAAAWCAAETE